MAQRAGSQEGGDAAASWTLHQRSEEMGHVADTRVQLERGSHRIQYTDILGSFGAVLHQGGSGL